MSIKLSFVPWRLGPKSCPAQEVLHNKQQATFVTPAKRTPCFSNLNVKDGCSVSMPNFLNVEKNRLKEFPTAGVLLVIFGSAWGLRTLLSSLNVVVLFHHFPGQRIKPAIRWLFALHENKVKRKETYSFPTPNASEAVWPHTFFELKGGGYPIGLFDQIIIACWSPNDHCLSMGRRSWMCMYYPACSLFPSVGYRVNRLSLCCEGW